MFIYIVINETNYPIGSFSDIQDAREYRDQNINCKIIKSTLVGNLPSQPSQPSQSSQPSLSSNLLGKMGLTMDDIKKARTELPDEYKQIFGKK